MKGVWYKTFKREKHQGIKFMYWWCKTILHWPSMKIRFFATSLQFSMISLKLIVWCKNDDFWLDVGVKLFYANSIHPLNLKIKHKLEKYSSIF